MTLTELHIYRLKVGLPVREWSVSYDPLGKTQLALSRSDAWLDQITEDGWAVLGLFTEDGQIDQKHYVKLPVELADDQLEEVFDGAGQPARLQEKAPIT